MEEEVWRDIKGWEGFYQASSLGRIRSVGRIMKFSYGYRWKNGKIRKQRITPYGYCGIMLNRYTHKKFYLVHRLIAETFIDNTENKPHINHKNGIKDDNRIENIEWCTRSENIRHSIDVLGRKSNLKGKFGKDHHSSKPVAQYTKTGKLINVFEGTQDAARKTGFLSCQISSAARGLIHTAYGYKWEYVYEQLKKAQ